ncbi:medium chain dehydrogenase/reductase family protein [Gemmatimonadota bacterium]
MKYRRVVVSRHGGPDVLQVVEEDLPEPQPGEIRVKVLAAGVSGFDLMMRRSGALPGSPRVPFTPGCDIVGLVDELGEGVSEVQPGQMVASIPSFLGGYAEYTCQPAGNLVPVPPGLDPAEAVCLVANYLTAHLALHETAGVKSGERILVHGAAGGVGTAFLQLGELVGLEMYGTASRQNHELVSDLGATPIDYRNEDFVERIRSLTGDGVDVVFDPVSGARQLWRSHRALRRGGRLIMLGVAASSREGMKVIPLSLLTMLLLKLIPDGRRALLLPNAGKYAETQNDWYQSTLKSLLDYLAEGRIKPVVAERIPLVEAARAHELLERGGVGGKLVLITSEQAQA